MCYPSFILHKPFPLNSSVLGFNQYLEKLNFNITPKTEGNIKKLITHKTELQIIQS